MHCEAEVENRESVIPLSSSSRLPTSRSPRSLTNPLVTCVRFPFYAAAVERRERERLTEQPLVIQQDVSLAVYSMSQEAARAGVRLDVPLREARIMCPSAEILPPSLPFYERSAQELTRWLLDFTHRVEPRPTRPALAFYVDGELSAENRAITFSQEIGRTLREQSHLAPAIGIANNKFAAYLAAKFAHAGRVLPISAAATTQFVQKVPLYHLSLPDALRQRCRLFGLQTLGDFAALPFDHIPQQFGDAGMTLYRLAQGHDPRRVATFSAEEELTWQQQYDDPICSWVIIERVLWEGARDLVQQLKKRTVSARGLTLKMALDNGDTIIVREQLSKPTQALRHIGRQLQTLFQHNQPPAGLIDLQVALSYLAPILHRQLNLFEPVGTDETLVETIEHLSDRHGQRFFHLRPEQTRSRLPERRYQVTPHAAVLG